MSETHKSCAEQQADLLAHVWAEEGGRALIVERAVNGVRIRVVEFDGTPNWTTAGEATIARFRCGRLALAIAGYESEAGRVAELVRTANNMLARLELDGGDTTLVLEAREALDRMRPARGQAQQAAEGGGE